MSPPEGGNIPSIASYEANTITSLLTSTATHLQIRSEVSSVLSSLLSDVETTSALSSHLAHKSHTASLQRELDAARTALAESRAVTEHESWRRQQLGDAFLVELAKLSLKLDELEGWRADNEGRVQECEALRRRLEEMTDRAQALELAVQEAGGQGQVVGESEGEQPTDRSVAESGADVPKEEATTTTGTNEGTVGVSAQSSDAGGAIDAAAGQSQDEQPPTIGTKSEEKDVTIPPAEAAAESVDGSDGGDEMPTTKDANEITTTTTIDRQPDNDEGKATSTDADEDTSAPDDTPDEKSTAKTGIKKKKKVLQPPTAMDETDPVLECVPERALMTIFANLEAHDILSTAQVSVVMYSRVDILFGLGGGGGGGGEESGESATSSDDAAVVVEEIPTAANADAGATSSSQPVAAAAAAAASSTASALGSTQAGGLFSPFGRNAKPAPTAAAAASSTTADATSSTSASAPTTTSSAAKNDKTTATASTSAETTSTASDIAPTSGLTASAPTSTGRGRGPMLTPELANSMAEKLSRDELAVIISMQKAQKASESDLSKLRNERDDLIAELKGVESVKDFLVAKLRDVERAQRLAESEKEKVARQVVSDQEVIAFLDYRVQELEGGAEIADRAKTRAEQDLQAAQAKATEKTRVLSDMLRFERDQLAASEKEWKATKKVLVKEVKQCRANIASLEAERDGLREQNARLREALLSGGKK